MPNSPLSRRRSLLIPLSVLPLVSALTVGAVTWHVEKDGSGDFTVIQDAVDASAAGDTVRIGPGRYEEWRVYSTPDGDLLKMVHPPHDLTFIGAGWDETILGPETLIYEQDGYWVTAFNNRGLNADLVVEDLTIEHVGDAFWVGSVVSLRRLRLQNLRRNTVLLTLADSLDVQDCEAIQPIGANIGASINHSFDGQLVDVVIRRSRFVGGVGGVLLPNARLVLEDSVFEDTWGPICWASGSAVIRRCRMTGPELESGIWIDNSVVATIEDCWVDPPKGWSLRAGLGASVVGERNHFSGSRGTSNSGIKDTISLGGTGTSLVLRNSDILRQPGTRWSVFNGSTTYDIDLRWNYWGTAEIDSIATWVGDRSDCVSPDCQITYVLYEPYLDHSVPIPNSSIGGLKALFGGGHE